ncbi:hypothetical protein ACO1PK_07325 [Alishewanella sp. d11]|uniref:hypothetical protein n=1 Tax=Alishewanella sp. d11 TaxID=3414030 RepID=UPI003BF86D04
MQRNWHHGYLLPVGWAILIHLLFFALLLQPLPVSPPPVIVPISSYLYTAAKPVVLAAPLLTDFTDVMPPPEPEEIKAAMQIAATPSSSIAQETLSAPNGSTESADVLDNASTPEHARIDTETRLVIKQTATPATSSSLAERALAGITQQHSAPVADYAGWAKQQQQPRLTVAREYQQLNTAPAAGVLFTYTDGKQLVRLNNRCMIVEPALDFFSQQMKAKSISCEDSDDAILFRQTMSKWLEQ